MFAHILRIVCLKVSDERSYSVLHKLYKNPQAVLEVILVKYLKHDLLITEIVHKGYFVAHHFFLAFIFALDEL